VGVGYTPEGLDQNPAYYELLQEAAFKAAPERNLTAWLVKRAHRRYGLQAAGAAENADVAAAWAALGASGYARNEAVSDTTGVGISPGEKMNMNNFAKDLATPLPAVCLEWASWGSLNAAAPAVRAAGGGGNPLPAPFTYDLVNGAREVLAQLATPLSVNFSNAFSKNASPGYMEPARLNATGATFRELLLDLDRLLATDTAFMLGPWLASARQLGGSETDCTDTVVGDDVLSGSCADFMEWNARSQLTSWYPTPSATQGYPGQQHGRDHDYARKQWSGLVSDVYAARATLFLEQALRDAAMGRAYNTTAATRAYGRLSYEWQTSFGAQHAYPVAPAEDPVVVSVELRAKWAPYFAKCS
jgi:alpha-N-acetylglucosaminidase